VHAELSKTHEELRAARADLVKAREESKSDFGFGDFWEMSRRLAEPLREFAPDVVLCSPGGPQILTGMLLERLKMSLLVCTAIVRDPEGLAPPHGAAAALEPSTNEYRRFEHAPKSFFVPEAVFTAGAKVAIVDDWVKEGDRAVAFARWLVAEHGVQPERLLFVFGVVKRDTHERWSRGNTFSEAAEAGNGKVLVAWGRSAKGSDLIFPWDGGED